MCQIHTYIRGLTPAFAVIALAFTGRPAAAQQPTAEVYGRIVAPTGEMVEHAEIRVVGLGRTVDADEGRFVLTVPAGSHVLEVTSALLGRAVRRITVAAGERLEMRIVLEPVFHAEPIIASVGPDARTQTELYQVTDVLTGRDLTAKGRNSLGETLAEQPGVNSTYYGPGSSRPVIRGLQSDRVRILESGVSSGDVSASGPDHAVALEPMLAEQIEIIRGPSTLLYGSSAIGGAVNTIDARIPRESTDHTFRGFAQVQGGSVNEELNGGLSLGGSSDWFSWHASGLLRNSEDTRIPGVADIHESESEGTGRIENSAVETTTGSLGGSYVGDAGYVGLAATTYSTEYGVPGHEHAHEETEAAEDDGVQIDLDQLRFDLEGAWSFGGSVIRRAKLRAGYSDYEHKEMEGDVIGTRFDNRELDSRLEATHAPIGPVSGTLGAQFGTRDMTAAGEEAFMPGTDTKSYALFAYEEIPVGSLSLGVGARWERADNETVDGVRRDNDGFSASLGLNWPVNESFTLTFSGSRSTKLPTAVELFADGPHVATRLYEIGDPDLRNEIGYSLDAAAILSQGPVTGQIAGFVNSFDDFIYLTPTDSILDGLTVATFGQSDARFYGFEVSLLVSILHRPGNHLGLTASSDYVHAEETGSGMPLPLIPPLRWSLGGLWEYRQWRATIDVRRTEEQTRVAEFETPTPGYTMLNASVSYSMITGAVGHEITLRGTNLTNEEARNHVSLLKDVAPLPGIDVRLTYRLLF
jgi:iron complex outermembrane receptor protein